MASNKLNNIWKVMKDVPLLFDGKVDSELICTICKNVMVKASNGPCGCRYCWDCIVNHLNCKGKVCPAGLKECSGEIINVDKNIQIDQPINTKISKLIVKCPQPSCQSKCELRMIEDHMDKCVECLIQCPYHEMGCFDDKVLFYKVKDHLTVKDDSHNRLMVDSVNNLKNEVSLLKSNIESLTKQTDVKITKIKEEIDKPISKLDDNLSNVTAILKTQVQEIEKIHSLQMTTTQENQAGMERKNNVLELDILKQQICSLQDSNESLIRELAAVKVNAMEQKREKEKEIAQLFQDYRALLEENTVFMKAIDSLKASSSKQYNSIGGYRGVEKFYNSIALGNLSSAESLSTVSTERTEEEQEETSSGSDYTSDEDSGGSELDGAASIQRHKSKLRLLAKRVKLLESNWNSANEFIWVIGDLSKKRRDKSGEKVVYSEPFFSHPNGYKMRLLMYPNGKDGTGRTLSVGFSTMKGSYDNILRWPFQHDVVLSLINQATGENHKIKVSMYKNSPKNIAWKKPRCEVNHEKCFWNFIAWNEVEADSDLFCQDQIFIKCLVKLKD